MNERLKITIVLNTRSGIMANMPRSWWDDDQNHISIGHYSGSVQVEIDGEKKTVLQWLFNLGKDGRYALI